MKIMLAAVNSKYIHSNHAVYSLRAYAHAYRDFLVLKEYTINQKKDDILKGIYLERPDVLCFSCYIWNISLIKEIAQEIHKLLPGMRIWLGGPEVSYDGERILQAHSFVTGIMRGEGEATFLELVQYYVKRRSSLEMIPGITWHEGADSPIMKNPDRSVMPLDEIPFPYEDVEDFEHRIIYYESSRGCPFSCSYCLSSIDRSLRFRSVKLVEKELQFFLDHNVPQVKFVDRTFNCNHAHGMAIWSYIMEHDNGITNFHFEIAGDLLNEEEIALLNKMRPGLVQLEMGVQSLNKETLKAIRRTMDYEKVSRNVKAIQRGKNVHQHLDLIAGLPYEDYESFGKSFDGVYQLAPGQLQLGFLKVLKGSAMEKEATAYGCASKSCEPYEVLKTRWLSYDDVLRLKSIEEMVEVYYNTGQFEKSVALGVLHFSSAFAFYEALADYYEGKGYAELAHSRLSRYDILREFFAQLPDVDMAYAEELLLFDLYAREKVKKRPQWAPDYGRYREAMRTFYQREKEEYQYLQGYEDYDERQMSKMTHIEVFCYDLEKISKTAVAKESPYMVLFDYRKRNVLTYNAVYYQLKDKW